MGKHCCENKSEELVKLKEHQSHVLKIVLGINAAMFFIEFAAGVASHSTSLLADSLDMFGDAVVYGFSLYVLNKSIKWRTSAAMLKGLIMTAFGFGVLGEAVYKSMTNVMPVPTTMGIIGALALVANTICLFLLLRHRDDDINMRSTWLCSRNDIIANVGVLAAGLAVGITGTKWPDILVGVVIAILFLSSATQILRDALRELKS